jgi:3-oxoadipate enol-lactonase
MLGYERIGSGERRLLVMNDWVSDTSSWEGARYVFDTQNFTWLLVDLRGYGRSRHLRGQYTVEEVATDVLALATELGWERFSVVGHSMTTLVALHLAQTQPERVERAVLVAPVPPRGLGVDAGVLGYLQGMARGTVADRVAGLKATFGDAWSDRFWQFKAERWLSCAEPDAAAAYAKIFACDGLPDPTATVSRPVLVITGERDGAASRSAAMRAALEPLCSQLQVQPLQDCGHYPMQEAPPLVTTLIERFAR